MMSNNFRISQVIREFGDLRRDYIKAVNEKNKLLDLIDNCIENPKKKKPKACNGDADEEDVGQLIDTTA